MSAPGQDIDDLVQNIGIDQLTTVVGRDLVATLLALNGGKEDVDVLRSVAARLFHEQPGELFSQKEIRALCYGGMTRRKIAELAQRIGCSESEITPAFDPTSNSELFAKYIGFFGIDSAYAIPAIAQPDEVPIEVGFGLFPHQRRAAYRVWNAIGDGYGRVVLHMPTGAGKTRTAMHVIARCLGSTEPGIVVWLASSRELLDQATEAFSRAWPTLGNREVSLMRFWGAHEPEIGQLEDGLLVAGLQKMHAWGTKNPIELLRLAARVKLVVVDEAHQAIAPTYRAIIDKLSSTGKFNAVLGLTATPGRTWSNIASDEELSSFFGERKVMLEIEGYSDPVSYLMNEGYLARPEFRRLEFKDNEEIESQAIKSVASHDDYSDEILDIISRNVSRNVCIVEDIKRLIAEGHNRIIVFAASVRHAELLAATLSAVGVDGRVVTGETPLGQRRRTIKAFRAKGPPMVLCNFGVLTTGFDAPNTSAAVIARPTKSLVLYSQMVGRATRGPKAGGNEKCVVSTVVDIDLPGFGDVAEAFTNWEDVWNEPS